MVATVSTEHREKRIGIEEQTMNRYSLTGLLVYTHLQDCTLLHKMTCCSMQLGAFATSRIWAAVQSGTNLSKS